MEKRNWFNKTFKEVEKELETDLEKGLSKEKVEDSLVLSQRYLKQFVI